MTVRSRRSAGRTAAGLTAMVCLCGATLAAQCTDSSPVPAAPGPAGQIDSLEGVAAEVQQLRIALDAMRRELQAVRDQLESLRSASGATASGSLAEEQELLGAKVSDLEQTKIESGSKYHVRLSGLALLNVVGTRGSVDNLDLPLTAQSPAPGESGGTVGAGVRQSLLNLEVLGPTLGAARTTASMAFDFFGGFPATSDGVSAPLVRLRTATFNLEWKNTSLTAGQDVPFFSPRSPTSLTSTAYPALSSAGNIWAWTPQLHVERRMTFATDSTLMVQFGILDPFTGQPPFSEYSRTATAGERSRMPAQAMHIGWQRAANARPLALGAGAYHASQDWGFGRTVEAWAATADWDVPLGRRFAFSGEFYRGRAIGGLGGGTSVSVLVDGSSPASSVWPVDSAGGWSQLKFKPTSRLEFNVALGEDNPFRDRLRRTLAVGSADASTVTRNASGFVNTIFQPRSNLLFSVEYRRLWTTGLDEATRTADHVSVSTGIVF